MLQAVSNGEVVGAIVCKLDVHKKVTVRGYIAMLAVDHRFRKRKIGKLEREHCEQDSCLVIVCTFTLEQHTVYMYYET